MRIGLGTTLAIALFASAFVAAPAALAQSVLDEVGECDLLAAHPADPQRLSDGVPEAAIVPRLALRACDQAMRAGAQDQRIVFQLGRAFLAASRRPEARAQFAKAAGAGYPAALAVAADLSLTETPPPVIDADPNVTVAAVRAWAERLHAAAGQHARAAEGGFGPSRQRRLALTLATEDYTQPIVGQVASGRFPDAIASAAQAQTRAYLYAFVTNMIAQCGPSGLPATAVARLAVFRFGGSVTQAQEEMPIVSVQPLIGEIDAQRFVRRHGCEENGMQGLIYLGLAGFLEAHAASR